MPFDSIDKLAKSKKLTDYYKVGDMVIPKFANYNITGIVVDIDDKIEKIYVDFDGKVSQCDPMDITVYPMQKNIQNMSDIATRVAKKMVASKTVFAKKLAAAIVDDDYYKATEMIKEKNPDLTNIQISRVIENLKNM